MENELLRLDLQGVICPMNLVRAKLALEELEGGQRLEVILDGGDAMLSVPRSLKEEGHRICQGGAAGRDLPGCCGEGQRRRTDE